MKNLLKKQSVAITTLLLIGACSNTGESENAENVNQEPEMEMVETKFQNSGKYAAIKELQILDPSAPARNAGVVNSLNGDVGKKAMDNYRKSTYEPKEGRASSNSSTGSSTTSGGRN